MDESLVGEARRARADIVSGVLRGAALLDLLLSIPALERDAWVDEALGLEAPPPDVDLPRGAVPYLRCGVDEIIATVREVPIRSSDDFVDLGSGMGRVVMLAHLLSGARALGIELQEHLVRGAVACAAGLALPEVSFVHANAADVELDGSIFFLYAPFNGELLRRVLDRLESVARRRAIVVCAVDLEFRDVAWLAPRTTACRSLAIYDSRASATAPSVTPRASIADTT